MPTDHNPEKHPYRITEEDLILEVAEDKRLRRLGIDPDSDPLEIYLELKRRIAAREPVSEEPE